MIEKEFGITDTQIKSVLSKTPLCCKVIRRHFLSKYSDEDKTKIEAEVPNLKYIWLRRHNNYERAISLYFSLKNRLWRTTKDSKKEYFKNNPRKPTRGSKGFRHYNNGIETKFVLVCPEGYVLGKIKK